MCDVCIKEKPIVGVAASPLVPMSLGYCIDCLQHAAEPVGIFQYMLDDVANGDPTKLISDMDYFYTWIDGDYISWKDWLKMQKKEVTA